MEYGAAATTLNCRFYRTAAPPALPPTTIDSPCCWLLIRPTVEPHRCQMPLGSPQKFLALLFYHQPFRLHSTSATPSSPSPPPPIDSSRSGPSIPIIPTSRHCPNCCQWYGYHSSDHIPSCHHFLLFLAYHHHSDHRTTHHCDYHCFLC